MNLIFQILDDNYNETPHIYDDNKCFKICEKNNLTNEISNNYNSRISNRCVISNLAIKNRFNLLLLVLLLIFSNFLNSYCS